MPKPPLIVFLIGLILWIATTCSLRRAFVGDWGDDGQYLISGRSLCDLNGYRLSSRPGNPVATKYPIGTPLLAALVMSVLPGQASPEHDWWAGRIVVVVAALVFASSCLSLFRLSGLSEWPAILLSLTVLWLPPMIHLTATLMSDVPFAALSLMLVVRWIRRSRSGPSSDRGWLIDGFLAGFAWLIRANGFTLVIAALVAAFQSKSRWSRVAAVLIGVACMKIPASLYVFSLPGARDTGNYLTEQVAAYQGASHVWSFPLSNLTRIPRLVLSTIFPPSEWTGVVKAALSRWDLSHSIAAAAMLGMVVFGMIQLIHRRAWPTAVWVHFVLTMLTYVFWYYPIDHRFALPLIPFILLGAAIGLGLLTKRRGIVPLFCATSLAGSLLVVLGMIWRSYPHGGVIPELTTPRFRALFEIVAVRTPPEAVVICSFPEFLHLNTGRLSAPLRDDELIASSRPVSLARLQYWFNLAKDRPLYLVSDTLNDTKEVGIEKVFSDGPYHLKLICPTPNGSLWSIERPPPSP